MELPAAFLTNLYLRIGLALLPAIASGIPYPLSRLRRYNGILAKSLRGKIQRGKQCRSTF